MKNLVLLLPIGGFILIILLLLNLFYQNKVKALGKNNWSLYIIVITCCLTSMAAYNNEYLSLYPKIIIVTILIIISLCMLVLTFKLWFKKPTS